MSEIQTIVMPKWGLAMEEGALTSWLVQRIPDRQRTGDRGDRDVKTRQRVRKPDFWDLASSGREGGGCPAGWSALSGPRAACSLRRGHRQLRRQFRGRGARGRRSRRRGGRAKVGPKRKDAGLQGGWLAKFSDAGLAHPWLRRRFRQLAFQHRRAGETRPVYAVDLPGHGKSSKTLNTGDIRELAQAVADLIDETHADKVHLVGHSLGGAVAFQVLRDQPERVASVVGVAPVGFDDHVNADFVEGIIAAQKRKDVKAALQLLLSDPDLVSPQMVEGVLRFKRIEGAKEALRTIADRNLPSGRQTATFRDLVEEDRVPVMIVWGERETQFSIPQPRRDFPRPSKSSA